MAATVPAPRATAPRRASAAPAAAPIGLLQSGYRTADRALSWLLIAHLPLVAALAPLRGTWLAAGLWGGGTVALGWLAARVWRGRLAARLSLASALLILSALIIHQSGGMIEMHFHIFAVLAFLLIYRDWRVPVAGAVVVAVHHVLFNWLQERGAPVVIFQDHTGWGIVAVHAGWVVFEVAGLVYIARMLAAETRHAERLVGVARGLAGGAELTGGRTDAAIAAAITAIESTATQLAGNVSERAGRVRDMAGDFSYATDHVTRAAEGVADSLAQAADAASSQAQTIQQMAQALDGMMRSLGEVADRSDGVARASAHALEVARSGSDEVGRSMRSMEQIQQGVRSSAALLGELRAISDRIGHITQVLEEIAEQTNLLALNAAIEAARAGEHGRGFAVVAAEVRQLAVQSGGRAREVASLVEEVRTATERTVEAMQSGLAEADHGAAMAASTEVTLREIVEVFEQGEREVASITASAAGIARASRQVLEETGLIGDAEGSAMVRASRGNAQTLHDAAAAVEQITASMQEMAASAQDLTRIADELQREVGQMRGA